MKLKFADAEDKLNTLTLVPENAVDTALLAAIPRSAKVTGARLDVVESSVYAEIRIAPAAPSVGSFPAEIRIATVAPSVGGFPHGEEKGPDRGDAPESSPLQYRLGFWINGRDVTLATGPALTAVRTYEEIVKLAGFSGDPSVTWRRSGKGSDKESGILSPGQACAT